jgi:hypothetical protein
VGDDIKIYFDMTPERRSNEPEETFVARQRLDKQVFFAVRPEAIERGPSGNLFSHG